MAAHGADAGSVFPPELVARLGRLAPGDAGRAARAEVIEWFLPLAVNLARRFQGRGEPLGDLTQVAVIGLIRAVDRFDTGRGVPFACYATPTILGSIKRHFRDTTWNVRVPRRMQELVLHLNVVTEELAQVLRRSPTTVELASRLEVSPADVRTARLCANAYRPISADRPLRPGGPGLLDAIGDLDPRIDAVDWREALRVGLAVLAVRDRRIIALRFFADMTQSQIAAELGISQMHVSRLLTQALARLRAAIHTDDPEHAGPAKPALGYSSSRPQLLTLHSELSDPAHVVDGVFSLRGRKGPRVGTAARGSSLSSAPAAGGKDHPPMLDGSAVRRSALSVNGGVVMISGDVRCPGV